MNEKVSAIICAAGKGERAGLGKNKLLAPLYGAPALFHTLKKFSITEIDEVIVASSPSDLEEITALCKPFGYKTVIGGATRTQTVINALEAVTGDIVLIHDGARPFVDKHLILSCIGGVKKFGSAVAAVKFTDTAAAARNGEISNYPDRESLYRVQTPQGFYTHDIKKAYRLANGAEFTDDSAVYLRHIAPPHIIEGAQSNIKLTYKDDFPREYALPLTASGQKIGIGADTHTFGEGSGITLGGVRIPHNKTLIAHSDGDVLVHAVMDAYLSAAGLKDIGHYFPDTDESNLNADSIKMLEKVIEITEAAGYIGVNLSVTVQAEAPRLSPHIENMSAKLCKACKLSAENIAIAAGTCEGLGFVGEGLGITAYAAVLLNKKL